MRLPQPNGGEPRTIMDPALGSGRRRERRADWVIAVATLIAIPLVIAALWLAAHAIISHALGEIGTPCDRRPAQNDCRVVD